MTTSEKVRIGRRIYGYYSSQFIEPSFPGYTNIIVMIRNDPRRSEYGALSSFSIKVPVPGLTDNDTEYIILENY
jgi:hypothetical protein